MEEPGIPIPTLMPIKNGWLARGPRWAVRGRTQEEARRIFDDRVRWYAEVITRPAPVPQSQ